MTWYAGLSWFGLRIEIYDPAVKPYFSVSSHMRLDVSNRLPPFCWTCL